MHFFTKKIPFLTQISKRSTHTDLHHPPLHLAQFFSLESLKISSAYSKTSLGLKMEKFFQTNWVTVRTNSTSFLISLSLRKVSFNFQWNRRNFNKLIKSSVKTEGYFVFDLTTGKNEKEYSWHVPAVKFIWMKQLV